MCNFGPLLSAPLRLFLEMIFLYMCWLSGLFWTCLGREFRCFGSVDLATVWIAGSCSWPQRNLESGLRGCLMNTVMEFGAERGLRDNLVQPFQTDADTPEPREVKWLAQGLRMNLWQKPDQNSVLSSKDHPLPVATHVCAQLCLVLCDPMDVACRAPPSTGVSRKNPGVGCYFHGSMHRL